MIFYVITNTRGGIVAGFKLSCGANRRGRLLVDFTRDGVGPMRFEVAEDAEKVLATWRIGMRSLLNSYTVTTIEAPAA